MNVLMPKVFRSDFPVGCFWALSDVIHECVSMALRDWTASQPAGNCHAAHYSLDLATFTVSFGLYFPC